MRSAKPSPPRSLAGAVFAALLVGAFANVAMAARQEQPGAAAAGPGVAPEAAGSEERNPLPYSPQTIAEGRQHYLRHCQSCHGYDGRARENIDFEATDLTNPEAWRFGVSDAQVFRTTKKGAGQDMPPFADRLEDREIWELVHYLRSIGPEKLRPRLETDGGGEGGASAATEPPSSGSR
jgi:mono/diheme cytochrome c family protein